MKNLLVRFIREEEGQDIIEYALLAAFISIVAFTILQTIGTDVTTPWLRWILVGCVATVAAATVARLVRGRVVAEQA